MTARLAAQWASVPIGIGGLTLLALAADANAITAGFLYFPVVLGLATWAGWAAGAAASVAATLCLNYFFLPPLGTFHVEDPSNWVALGCFLASSTLVSHLVTRARREAETARGRQLELEVLHELSFGLFTATHRPGALDDAAARTLRAIGASSGSLVLDGAPVDAARQGSGIVKSAGTSYIPLQVGGHVSGVLAAREPTASLAVLDPAVRLLALAIERERLLRETARMEAVRESDALKTALLHAVSHDLRTPLTSMRLEIESLEPKLADRPEALDSLRGLSFQQERLTRRIDNLLALARLEAGASRPQPEPTPAGSLFRAARESLALVLDGRDVEVRVAAQCPDLWIDPSLMLEVLVNLLENAARAAPFDRPLELSAEPGSEGRVRIEVRDRGPGMPSLLQGGGLGLTIARSLAEANGGTLDLLDRPGGGTLARLDLPAAPEPPMEEEVG